VKVDDHQLGSVPQTQPQSGQVNTLKMSLKTINCPNAGQVSTKKTFHKKRELDPAAFSS
jgi:hypothetical protein